MNFEKEMYRKSQLRDFKLAISNHRRELLNKSTDLAKNQVSVVDTAYQSILTKNNKKAYFSTPITSGIQLYEVCKSRGIKDLDSLNNFRNNEKEAFYNEVIKVNIENSLDSARKVANDYNGCVIAPAIFEAKKLRWSQEEYMNMWLTIIDRDVTDIYAKKGYAYSDGAVMELTHAALMTLNLCDRNNINILLDDGSPITIYNLIENIINAANEISIFTPPKTHAEALLKLYNALRFSEFENMFDEHEYKEMIKMLKYWLYDNFIYARNIDTSFLIWYDEINSKLKQYNNKNDNKTSTLVRNLSNEIILNVVK